MPLPTLEQCQNAALLDVDCSNTIGYGFEMKQEYNGGPLIMGSATCFCMQWGSNCVREESGNMTAYEFSGGRRTGEKSEKLKKLLISVMFFDFHAT